MKIGVSKEEECKMLWQFLVPASENVYALADSIEKIRKFVNDNFKSLTHGDDEPDWKKVSTMLLCAHVEFTDYAKEFCLAYTSMLNQLKTALKVSEETDEEVVQ